MPICFNCNQPGHTRSKCPKPITSYGIICVKVNSETESDPLQFLLVQRSHSYTFLDFIRGKYNPKDLQCITNMFLLMAESEIRLISIYQNDFDTIWNRVWKSTARSKKFKHELNTSREKFNALRNGMFNGSPIYPLTYYISLTPLYKEPEWGFPKGHKLSKESSIKCAIREFGEETSYNHYDIEVLNTIKPLEEIYQGTDGVMYRHIYHVALLTNFDKTPIIEENNNEIGKIEWKSYEDAINSFRKFHAQKQQVLYEVYNTITNAINSFQSSC